jgi:predicted membrane channel-forming protein YqfA (hemolysin III family)
LLADADNKAPSAETRISDPAYNALMMEQEKSRRHLVVGLLIAMVLSQILVLWSLVRSHQSSASAVVHGSGLVLVVYATVIVVMLARADQQLTAAIGILGAIAGYLFGSATREPGTSRS